MFDALRAAGSRIPRAPTRLDGDAVWLGDTGAARIALVGTLGQGRAAHLHHEIRRLEGRALLVLLDLSGVHGAHPAALAVLSAAGHRAVRERRRVWVVAPEPPDWTAPDRTGIPVDARLVGRNELRRWLSTNGLTLVDAQTASGLGAATAFPTGAIPAPAAGMIRPPGPVPLIVTTAQAGLSATHACRAVL